MDKSEERRKIRKEALYLLVQLPDDPRMHLRILDEARRLAVQAEAELSAAEDNAKS